MCQAQMTAARNGNRIPRPSNSSAGSLPFPVPAIVCGELSPIKVSLRRAKNQRDLDRAQLTAKKKIG
jgi:hypothetical protein